MPSRERRLKENAKKVDTIVRNVTDKKGTCVCEKDIHVSHKGQGAATNREKGQGVTRTRTVLEINFQYYYCLLISVLASPF
jgi:hypothetical protein